MYLNISKPFCLILFLLILISNTNGVAQPCTAKIETDGRTVLCQGESTELRANTGTGLTYEWFRNGDLIPGAVGSTLQVSTPGDYTVRVSGSSCDPNTSDITTIQVDPRPNPPGFTVTPTTPTCSGTPIAFSVNAPSPDLVYTWDFGDGSTGRGAEVTHTYTDKGIGNVPYTVSVIATSTETSCESEPVTRTVRVNRMPEISFTEKTDFLMCLSDDEEDDGEDDGDDDGDDGDEEEISVTAEITNTTQEPYLSDIRSYTVDWGDGSGPIIYRASDFPISNPNPYTEIGEYEITITALAGNGCKETFTQIYSVNKKPEAGFEIDKQREEEDQDPPCVPVIVTPTDTSSGVGLTYRWLIQPEQGWTVISGDTNAADPVFKFTESGVYTIEQIVSNACGSDTASQSIIVGWPQVQPPTGGTFCGPTSVDFAGSGPAGAGGGSGSILIDKNLGENLTGSLKITGPRSATHNFTGESFNYTFNFDLPGTYTVSIEVRNECGSSNQVTGGQPASAQYVVLRKPTTPTVQNPGTVCVGDVVTLTASGPGPVFAWYDSNDPAAVPLQEGPSKTFTTPALAGGETFYVAAINNANDIVCQSDLRAIPITVRERIGDNTIEGDEVISVCKGGAVPVLTGSTPTGGDPDVPPSFLWIQSTTGPDEGFTAATNSPNNNKDYNPGSLSNTTWFRRVVSSANCTPDTSEAVQITAVDPIPPSVNTISPAQDICEGDTPQQLVGSSLAGVTYKWEISRTGPSSGFSDAPAPNNTANYTIVNPALGDTWYRRQVTSGGCMTPSDAIKITVSPKLDNNTVTPAEQDACPGAALATLTGSAPTGGKGNYQYEWLRSTTNTRGSFTGIPNTNTQSYKPDALTETTYFRRVVTSGACGADTSAAVVVRVRPAITGNSISGAQEVCAGVVPDEITGTAVSGGNFTYRWESSIASATTGFRPVSPAPAPTALSYTPSALNQNTWFRRVAISDQGCENISEPVLITVLPLPAPPVLRARNVSTCLNGSATLSVTSNGGLTYKWYDVATGGEPISDGAELVLQNVTQDATYYVEAVNDNECASSTRTSATVTVVEPVANAGPDVTIMQGKSTVLQATISNGTAATYLWEPAEGLSNPNVRNPVASPDETTTYTVTITTAEGCEATDEVTVEVTPALVIPNAFTPNRDGVNETWVIENIGEYPEARVEIFNRWGNIVFTSNGYGEPWDGTLNGSDLPVATYYYMIYLNRDVKPISGHVTIIR